MGMLASLAGLDLGCKLLTGTIPSELGRLSGVRHLDLSHNNLESTIPSEIGNMKGLQYLLLNDNELSGPIPSDLGRLSELNVLDLSSNQLTSSVPEEFRSLTGLTFPALLGFNQLTGQLSKDLCALDVNWFVDCEKVTCPTMTDGDMCLCSCAETAAQSGDGDWHRTDYCFWYRRF
jgi:Leucine-rich repeat (LRR) protein